MDLNTALCLAVARDVAREAALCIRRYYATELEIDTKGDERDLVTAADVAADRLITEQLQAAFPEHALLTEESGYPGQEIDTHVPTWIVDPLDGTSNFAHHLPIFSVSIGLWWHGRPQVGVVRDVMRGLTFSAEAGAGAWLNGEQISVTQHETIRGGIFAAEWSRDPERRRAALEAFTTIGMRAHTMRSLGCASLGLCAVAAGWIEGYFNLGLSVWDVAAGALVLQEAGGTFTDETGHPWTSTSRGVIATNGRLHDAVVASIREHLPE